MSQQTEPASRVTWLLAAHGLLTLVCAVLYGLDVSDTVSTVCFVAVGVSTATAMVVGPRLNRSVERTTWTVMLVVCLLFAAGPAVRAAVRDADGLTAVLPDAILLPGYALALWAMLRVMRLRGTRDTEAVLDVVVVVVGSLLL